MCNYQFLPRQYTCLRASTTLLLLWPCVQYLGWSPKLSACLSAPYWLEELCTAGLSHWATRSDIQTRPQKRTRVVLFLYFLQSSNTQVSLVQLLHLQWAEYLMLFVFLSASFTLCLPCFYSVCFTSTLCKCTVYRILNRISVVRQRNKYDWWRCVWGRNDCDHSWKNSIQIVIQMFWCVWQNGLKEAYNMFFWYYDWGSWAHLSNYCTEKNLIQHIEQIDDAALLKIIVRKIIMERQCRRIVFTCPLFTAACWADTVKITMVMNLITSWTVRNSAGQPVGSTAIITLSLI